MTDYQVALTLYFSINSTEEKVKVLAKDISDKAAIQVARKNGTGFLPVLKPDPSMIPQE